MKEDFVFVEVVLFGDDPVSDWQSGSQIEELNGFVLDNKSGKGCEVA